MDEVTITTGESTEQTEATATSFDAATLVQSTEAKMEAQQATEQAAEAQATADVAAANAEAAAAATVATAVTLEAVLAELQTVKAQNEAMAAELTELREAATVETTTETEVVVPSAEGADVVAESTETDAQTQADEERPKANRNALQNLLLGTPTIFRRR